MSEKLFICKKGWKRHSKGVIINEWEWKRLAIESREQFFEPYIQEPPASVEPTSFEKNLTKELEDKGIKAKFKHTEKDGKPELDATFTFGELPIKELATR